MRIFWTSDLKVFETFPLYSMHNAKDIKQTI